MWIFELGLWAIEHEDEILERTPPEKQPEVILAIAKMREGFKKLEEFAREISH